MRVALCVIAIGEKYIEEYTKLFMRSQKAYAERHGYDFKVITSYLSELTHPDAISFNKLLVCSQDWSTSYKFVVSPEGNGIDCHRHYEALLAGCIPIMERNALIEEKYRGCPILYTDDYSEITPTYLNAKYDEMKTQAYDFSRLFLEFYPPETQTEIKRCGNYWMKQLTGQTVY